MPGTHSLEGDGVLVGAAWHRGKCAGFTGREPGICPRSVLPCYFALKKFLSLSGFLYLLGTPYFSLSVSDISVLHDSCESKR